MSQRVDKANGYYERLHQRQFATTSKQLINAGITSEKLKPGHIKVYSNGVRELEKINIPRCYVNPYVRDLINNDHSAEELQIFLRLAVINYKNNWGIPELFKSYRELLDTTKSENEWEICKEVIDSHAKKGWLVTPLINNITRIVKSKPRPNEWELYRDIFSYLKKRRLSELTEFTDHFANVIETKFSDEEFKLFKELIEYQKLNKRTLSALTSGFCSLVAVRPNEKEWKIFRDLLSHYQDKERSWDVGFLARSFSELVFSKSTDEQLELYRNIISQFKGSDFFIENFTTGFAGLVAFKASPLILELYIAATTFHSRFEENEDFEFINSCCIGLAQQNPPRATIRNYIQAVNNGKIKTAEESLKLLGEIAVHSSICSLVTNSSEDVKDAARETIMYIGDSDLPPYTVYDDEGSVKPEAQKIYSETLSVYRRAFDTHHGFSALTFDTKRPPTKEPALLARFGKDVARKVEYINARDINGFPGRGFIISGLIPERIFVTDLTREDPFLRYKEAWVWASEIFDDLPKTKFIFTRGFIAISCEDNKYKLKDVNKKEVNYSYVVFNDHHHNYSNNVAFLVPTEVLNKKLKDTAIPYGDYVGPSTKHKDINEVGIKIEDLVLDARTVPANVLNIGWGSNVGGSLCNAYPPLSAPYHIWERREVKKDSFCDFYGHVHKSYVDGMYNEKVTKKIGRRFGSLKEAHNQVFQVTNRYQNMLDLFRISFALWHKGLTVGEEIAPFDESLDDLFERPKRDIEDQFLQESSKEEASLNTNSLRMLAEAYKWHQIKQSKRASKIDFPVLVTAPALNWWTKPESPFYLDTYDLTIDIEDKGKVQLPEDSNGLGFEESFFWASQIMPHVTHTSKDIRFYDRRDLGIE